MSVAAASVVAVALATGLLACKQAREDGGGPTPGAASPADDAAGGDDFTGAAPGADAQIGESVLVGRWRLVVEAADSVPEAGGAIAGTGQSLVVVTLRVANEGREPASTGPDDYVLEDGSGTEFLMARTTDPGFLSRTWRTIQAGATASLKVAYEVPDGADDIVLRFGPASAGDAPPKTVSLE